MAQFVKFSGSPEIGAQWIMMPKAKLSIAFFVFLVAIVSSPLCLAQSWEDMEPSEPHRSLHPDKLVDLNRATIPELMKAQGMTSGWAKRIVRFRPYRTKLELVDLGIITPEAYRRIRDGVIAHRVTPEIE